MSNVDYSLNLKTESMRQVQPVQPVCVEPDLSVRGVFQRLQQERRGAVLICEQGVLCGVFTERDALLMMAAGDVLDVPIEQVMIRQPVTLRMEDSVATAIGKMSAGGYRRLPIVDEANRPVGIVKVSGILHYLVEHFPEVVYTLPPKPGQISSEREGA